MSSDRETEKETVCEGPRCNKIILIIACAVHKGTAGLSLSLSLSFSFRGELRGQCARPYGDPYPRAPETGAQYGNANGVRHGVEYMFSIASS